MRYRVYSGPRGSETTSPIEKQSLLFKEFPTLDDALNWARHVHASGRVALFIDGDDGTSLNKRDIANALRHRETELSEPGT
ncbi:MAG TPA: hypothetical protein VFQ27_03550 [Xanthobacteraceae bacterium]|nr:hypothetical protein [Xanthobacteraceae bacterium]